MPQYAEGVRMDPEVSEPIANGTRPAATALPEPLDEPPDQQDRSQGFSPGPKSEAPADAVIATARKLHHGEFSD